MFRGEAIVQPIPFDDRDGLIWFDGALVDWRDAKLHVLTHGLHYASAVFEGERAYGGRVFKLREHSQRLIDSAALLGFDIPWTVEQIDAATRETLAANNLVDAYVRPIAWRGSEMLAVAARGTKTHLAIAVWPWPNLFGEARSKGITLGVGPWKRPAPDTAPTKAKATGLYMIATMNKHWAMDQGLDDCLMLDWKGDVAEATGANVFFVMDGELHTPEPICFLDGITRRTVMALARTRQIRVVERTIGVEELGRASEAFLCGTAAEVTPVRSIGSHQYGVGPVAKMLAEDYAALVLMPEDEVAKRAA